jgi:hypothetical protein
MSTNDPSTPAPKLIIDSDWKNQAQAEKEKLAAKEAAKPKAAAAGPGAGLGAGPAGAMGEEMEEFPEANFQTLLGTMVTQALMYMGAFPDPQTGRAVVSLEYARLHIDLIGVLQEKTKGNLTADEASAIAEVLGELKMRYVEIGKLVAQKMAERALGGAAGGAGSPKMPPSGGTGPKLVF